MQTNLIRSLAIAAVLAAPVAAAPAAFAQSYDGNAVQTPAQAPRENLAAMPADQSTNGGAPQDQASAAQHPYGDYGYGPDASRYSYHQTPSGVIHYGPTDGAFLGRGSQY